MVEEAVKDGETTVDEGIGVEEVVVVDAEGGEDHAEVESLACWLSLEPRNMRDAVIHHCDRAITTRLLQHTYGQSKNCCSVVSCLVRPLEQAAVIKIAAPGDL